MPEVCTYEFWIRESEDNVTKCDSIWIRGNDGSPIPVDKAWIRSSTGVPVQIFPWCEEDSPCTDLICPDPDFETWNSGSDNNPEDVGGGILNP